MDINPLLYSRIRCRLVNPAFHRPWTALFGVGRDPFVGRRVLSAAFWLSFLGTFIGAYVLTSSVENLQDPPAAAPPVVTTFWWTGIAVILLCWIATVLVRQHAWKTVIGIGGSPSEQAVRQLLSARNHATRFRRTALRRPELVALARRTIPAVQMNLWLAGRRVEMIRNVEARLRAAGANATGPAKAAYRKQLLLTVNDLAAPIARVAAGAKLLADHAEEAVFAHALAVTSGPTGELAAPTGREVLASSDIAGALQALRAWVDVWAGLDTEQRIMSQRMAQERKPALGS